MSKDKSSPNKQSGNQGSQQGNQNQSSQQGGGLDKTRNAERGNSNITPDKKGLNKTDSGKKN